MKTEKRDHPILFSAPMVLALLAGRKTMTRRLAWRDAKKGEATAPGDRIAMAGDGFIRKGKHLKPSPWQRVKPGEVLWVRESGFELTFAFDNDPVTDEDEYETVGFQHTADGAIVGFKDNNPRDYDCSRTSRPSIHMPRWASRLTLEITAVKIERMQDISDAEAITEGLIEIHPGFWWYTTEFKNAPGASPRTAFSCLWDAVHGYGAWDANPEVVALTFAVHQQNIDAFLKRNG